MFNSDLIGSGSVFICYDFPKIVTFWTSKVVDGVITIDVILYYHHAINDLMASKLLVFVIS